MNENQQEHVYREFIKFREAFSVAHQLLQNNMAAEARAVIAARLDVAFNGDTQSSGGYLGEFLIARYSPTSYEGQPESIQILPKLTTPKKNPEQSKWQYILGVCDYFEALVRDGIKDSYTFADVASAAQSSSSHVWEVLSEKVSEADRKIRYPNLANTSLNK
jgi:hypothetical protein